MQALARLVRLIEGFNRAVGELAAWLVLATVADLRRGGDLALLLGLGRIWLQELYVVCFAVCFMLVAPYAYATDGHIRIEVLQPALVAAHHAPGSRSSAASCSWSPGCCCPALVQPALRAPVLARARALGPARRPAGLYLVKTHAPAVRRADAAAGAGRDRPQASCSSPAASDLLPPGGSGQPPR